MTTDKLLPCPFCNSNAHAPLKDRGQFIVWCSSCGAGGGYEDTEAMAIETWNTRATTPLPDAEALVEKLVIHCGEPSPECQIAIGEFLMKLQKDGVKSVPLNVVSAYQKGFEAAKVPVADQETEDIIDAARRSLGDPYNPITIAARFDLRDAVIAYDKKGKV